MNNTPQDAVKLLAKRILEIGYEDLPPRERHVIERVARRIAVSRDGSCLNFVQVCLFLNQ
jgi:hypothetical protein